MEGFDNEVEKATPRGCSAAKQRSSDSNTAEKRKPPIEEGFHPYNNISAMGRVSSLLCGLKNLYSMGEEGLQWRASITKWRKQPSAVAPLPNSGPRIRTPRKEKALY